jgi:aminoglycoside 6'-N-acetyltransferase I
MWQIRPVTSADRDAWLEMRCALWPDGAGSHRPEVDRFFAGHRREPAEVLIARDDRGYIGFVELSIRNVVDGCHTGNVGYLEGWYVVPAARRQGAGRALVSAAEQWAREQGCTEFGSDASLDNNVSLAAHRALGFEETSRAQNFRKVLRGHTNRYGGAER